jgi:hypothetical protein
MAVMTILSRLVNLSQLPDPPDPTFGVHQIQLVQTAPLHPEDAPTASLLGVAKTVLFFSWNSKSVPDI